MKKKKARRTGRNAVAILLILVVLAGGVFGLIKYADFMGTEYKVYEGLPWELTLVNSEWAVPGEWNIEFVELRDDQRVDSRMYPELQRMFDDCREEGLYPLVWSSYRTTADQQRIFDDKVAAFEGEGLSHRAAKKEAANWAASPGYSEHQLGLAVDINSEDEALCSSWDVYAWLAEHCAEYGFILRYPEDKTEITGIDYEPWHFRYVGQEAAQEIMSRGICLEEYIEEYYG